MIAHRDRMAQEVGAQLIVHTNPEGPRAEHQPVRSRQQQVHDGHEDRRAQAGALAARVRLRLRRRAARRRALARQGARVLVPRSLPPVGPEKPAPRALVALQHAHQPAARACASSRSRTGPSSTCGSTSGPRTSRSCRSTSPSRAPSSRARGTLDHGRRRPHAPRAGRDAGDRRVRFRTLGCYPLSGAIESTATTVPEIIQEMLLAQVLRAPGSAHRPRRGRLDGEEEARGLLLMACDRDATLHSSRHRGVPAPVPGQGAPALRRRGIGRRRQVDAHRPAALRHRLGLRRPARGRRARRRSMDGHRRSTCRSHRRPRRRARAGHHDRRRLPVFHDRPAQVHHRRHPGARAVHAQHGDRRVDGERRDHPHRRAPRGPAAEPAPRVHRVAARHPAPRRLREQDGPRRLRPRASSSRVREEFAAFTASLGVRRA